jgi:hypothetical protein
MIVASRSLKLRQGQGDIAVAVRIFAPQPDQSEWSCAYEIDWPEGTRKFAILGFDSMQALLLALQMVGTEIYTSDYHKLRNLSWDKPGQGYGFPVAHSIRDLLEGDDAKHL